MTFFRLILAFKMAAFMETITEFLFVEVEIASQEGT